MTDNIINNSSANAPAPPNARNDPEPPVKYEIGTIRQIHQRLISEGMMVTEHALRVWVKSNQIPAVMVGQRAYISYSNVMSFLNSATANAHDKSQPSGVVRRMG